MNSQTIEFEKAGPVAKIYLSRAEKRNALSDELLLELQSVLDEIERDTDIRVGIISGRGSAFCAGFDLSPREHPLVSVQDWRDHVKLGNDTFWRIWKSRVPYIAAVNGFALGGGCDLSMVCDYTLAADTASFGEPEIQFQSAPPFNITPWVMGMKKAKEFLLFGDKVDANEARVLGLANRVVPLAELEHCAMETALRIARLPPPAVQLNKLGLNRSFEIRGFMSAIEYGTEIFTQVLMSDSIEASEFFDIVNERGVKAAFKWRDAKFASAN